MSRIADFLLANLMAEMFFKPSLFNQPSKKTVIEKSLKNMGFSIDAYLGWETEHFTVKSGDVEIPAEYHPLENHKGIAIMSHGYGQNRYILIPQAEILRKEGYSIIMYDQRHFGASKAPCCSFGLNESDDLIALINWAKNRSGENTRIIVLGVSMGAMTLMTALGKTDKIDAAIADCGPARMTEIYDPFYKAILKRSNPVLEEVSAKKAARLGIDVSKITPIDGVKKSDKPILVIQSEGDSLVTVSTAKEILASSRSKLSDIRIFPDVEHALSITFFDEYSSAIHHFLEKVFQ